MDAQDSHSKCTAMHLMAAEVPLLVSRLSRSLLWLSPYMYMCIVYVHTYIHTYIRIYI